jgi:nucleoside-diphosphate-sugar epimerase
VDLSGILRCLEFPYLIKVSVAAQLFLIVFLNLIPSAPMTPMASKTNPVLVTGGSGFVAMELISQLLAQGYAVHATVRSLQNTAKVSCLQDLKAQHPEGKLLLFEADLLQPGSFHSAVQGCDIVFHVASPFKVPEKIRDGYSEMVQPALEGTRNVLKAVEATPSVKRVVFTSTSESFHVSLRSTERQGD